MKIGTVEQLSDALDSDLAWRKRELTTIGFMLQDMRSGRASAVLRGGLTLLYAHWEGYIKGAAAGYLEFVSSKRLTNRHLSANFLALACRRLLRSGGTTNNIQTHIGVVNYFRDSQDERVALPSVLGTRGNLSSVVLRDITDVLGISFTPYETKCALIDESLVHARNTVAHGEYLLVTRERWHELHREVLALMEAFKADVMNAAVLGRYRRQG